MADDTRQQSQSPPAPREDLSREALTAHPENKPFTGIQWQGGKAVPYKAEENANMMPGGTQHTAGGQEPDVTFMNALSVGAPITEIHKRPCVRDALLTGMGAGFALGGVRFIARGGVWKACNWAVGSFIIGAGVKHQYCMYRRHAEKEGMMRAVEILNKKQLEREAKEQRKEKERLARREAKEKEQDAQFAALHQKEGGGKPWWKVW